ncbi:MAG TPA: SDR family NAD(P)-dependent oxidoreductase [Ktedonobacteraceae bacterium]|jgi:NAD(P)-dependent dehydrogenase (short-subunit alcohol dehydrogenase family)|nr:SDR family NAD(P)-dependent oxidoreductase [Ktedonobacteraceae bacterium]
MARRIEHTVVVITGASSGIGRATALEFARRGANVVVAARREALLREVAAKCKQISGQEALAIPTNVADEIAVQELARQVDKTDFQQGVSASPTPGNLFEPMQEGSEESGGWQGQGRTNMRRFAVAGAAAAGVWLWQRQRS